MVDLNLNKVNELLEDLKPQAINTLIDLIRIPTENPPGLNYDKVAEYLYKKLNSLGYNVNIINPSEEELKKLVFFGEGERPNVVGYLGSGDKRLLINGHYDVVPAGEGWSVDPYSGIIKDNKIYGRGAADMKAGIVSQIIAVEILRELIPNFENKIKIVQTFVPDEETVGNVNSGTYFLIKRGIIHKKDINYAIFTEPSGLENLCVGHRGAIWSLVKIYGKKAHGGFPQLGIDAVKITLEIIKELYKSIKNVKSNYNIIPEISKYPSILVGKVNCGTWFNTVADKCEFSIVRRLIPEESLEEVRMEILHIIRNIAEMHNAKYEYNEFYTIDTIISYDKNLIQVFRETIKIITGKEPQLVISPGTFDMRFTVQEGIPSINFGPGRIESAHATDEFVDIDDFIKSIKILSVAISKLI